MKKDFESLKIEGELTLITKEQESLLVSGDKNTWGNRKEHQVSASDFALANRIYQWHNDENLTKLLREQQMFFLIRLII